MYNLYQDEVARVVRVTDCQATVLFSDGNSCGWSRANLEVVTGLEALPSEEDSSTENERARVVGVHRAKAVLKEKTRIVLVERRWQRNRCAIGEPERRDESGGRS